MHDTCQWYVLRPGVDGDGQYPKHEHERHFGCVKSLVTAREGRLLSECIEHDEPEQQQQEQEAAQQELIQEHWEPATHQHGQRVERI